MSPLLIALADMTPAQLMALAGIAILVLTLMRRLAIRARRRPRPAPPERFGNVSDQIQSRANIDESAVKLHDMFREMNARAENKSQVLNELLLEADAKIAELKRLLRSTPSTPLPETSEKPRSTEDPLVIDMDAETNSETRSGGAETEASAGFAEVYRLSDQGLSALEISERTKHSAGEIDLILALRKVRQRSAMH